MTPTPSKLCQLSIAAGRVAATRTTPAASSEEPSAAVSTATKRRPVAIAAADWPT